MFKKVFFVLFCGILVFLSNKFGKIFSIYSWGNLLGLILFMVIIGGTVYYSLSGIFQETQLQIKNVQIEYSEKVRVYVPIWFYPLILSGCLLLIYFSYFCIKSGGIMNNIAAVICLIIVFVFVIQFVDKIYRSSEITLNLTKDKIYLDLVEINYSSIRSIESKKTNIVKINIQRQGIVNNIGLGYFSSAPIYLKLSDDSKLIQFFREHGFKIK